MGSSQTPQLPSKAALPFKTNNKRKRQEFGLRQKQARGKESRDEKFARKRAEDKDPSLRERRLAKNKTITLDQKRVWDDVDDDDLGARVDVERVKRRRLEEEEAAQRQALEEPLEVAGEEEDDVDSMLDAESDAGADDEEADEESDSQEAKLPQRDASLAPSTTSTHLDFTPSALVSKFPNLFSDDPPPMPKVLVTTSLQSTLHREAELLCGLFPNSNYIRRSAHRYAHKYSLREICKFASNREYTAVVLLNEDQKKPTGLSVVCLPAGPTVHFSISNWMEGKKIPGHGNPTNHYPELLLNNFKTPLGFLISRIFMRIFPPRPEFEGRQVVTMHNQRDYIFVRRHRYVFREKRQTEKSVVGADGKEMGGVEGIRAGLQELGPRFTLKPRRVDKGIGRAGSEGDDALQWEWRGKMDKTKTAFNV